ncbi:MAG TPA: LytTR family DNA-binding domain-containing protein [Sulfurovum sp.]|jgi:two-component system LytT family response regulator|nr:MAG: DNA-binding response regulator [Sulfurovum sp. 35-42-20]OYZ23929.1 MAG: DNA-binding response regulator [Sulfurovum sp. 16-42-52]OYZ48237.1 MAG: DNA-binding response regulator [Sulfurovum sp. 24-42-9]OZA43887.1 MAG: DNA-binding response regulator [Sulfurovum sp. 17-42-90]OZA60839.1 MAG: DNA-binding response regulator [Sulfurovum sp. 39-42-12]HQR74497.1 LytTR family DNA-binding domain-containing protein [Sulfurovum sp.]
MKILIVDDEALALARLKRMLTTLGYEDIIEADNAQSALKAVEEHHFDLVLLDINMPQTNGLKLGYELRYHQQDLAIIFQTAYDEHALKAFDIGAVGYLIKPFSIEQLKESIQRVNIPAKNHQDLRLMSKTGESYYLLKPEDIYYVKADLAEVMLRSMKGFSYYAQKISDIEKKLLTHNFIRIHRSYLININKIKEIATIEQSKLRFSFQDISDQIESSKDGAKAFRNTFSS